MRVLQGLAALFAGALVALMVYGTSSHRASSFTGPADAETGQAQQPSADSDAVDTESNEVVVVTPVRSVDDLLNGAVGEVGSNASLGDENHIAPEPRIDEDTARRVRESAVQEIRETYSLLFEDLGLTPQEKDELFSFLVEAQMASMWVYQRGGTVQRGRAMHEDERSSRIAAIIGDPKLQQFLALERNRATYSEVYRIGSLLERKSVPLTETQHDGLFDLLAAIRNGDYVPMPPSDVESDSKVEDTLFRINERERYIIELAPSVLSPQQVVYLHERYQHCSDERAYDLERQKKRRADHPSEDFPLGYVVCIP